MPTFRKVSPPQPAESALPKLTREYRALETDAAAAGTTVDTRVSTLSTDPWTGRVASPEPAAPHASTEGHP